MRRSYFPKKEHALTGFGRNAGLAGLLGLTLGLCSCGALQVRKEAVAEPYDECGPHNPEDMRRRNIVWQVLNENSSLKQDSSPESTMASALYLILLDEPDTRVLGMGYAIYADRLTFYFGSVNDLSATRRAMFTGTPQERAAAFAKYAAADFRAAKLVHCVLRDQTRIGLFQTGKKIPLETLPDGRLP